MRKLHAFASLAFLLVVALACKRGADASGSDASIMTTVTGDPSSTVATAPASWKVGDTVDVEWSGTWYESQILAVQPGPQYKIHYVGWGSNYDETVGPSRMRARANAAPINAMATAASSTPAATSTANASPFTAGCRAGWSKPRLEPGTECMQECANATGERETCPTGFVCKSSPVWVSPHCDKKVVLNAGCRPGWSKPMLDTECMQECTRASNTRETCPEGLVCTNARMWSGPHCSKL